MVWYYANAGVRQGPVDESEFNRLVGQEVVRPDTLVWCEGMPDWRPYSAVAPVAPPTPAPAPPVETPAELRAEMVESRPEAAPVTAVAEAPVEAAVPAPETVTQLLYCSQCQRPYPSEELVRFGTATICANCKDTYAQRLRETGHVAGARIYGGFWIRYLAVIIDSIVQAIPVFAIALPLMFATRTGSSTLNEVVAISRGLWMNLLSIGVALLYEAFFLVKYGATPGKMVLSMKVITPEGGGLSWGRAIGRHLSKYLSFPMTLGIGYIMAGFDAEKRALHDHIAGTRVIRTR
jgi:uncharacterized RDD family membrane protein YckC